MDSRIFGVLCGIVFLLVLVVTLEFWWSYNLMANYRELRPRPAELACHQYSELRRGLITQQRTTESEDAAYRVLGPKAEDLEYPHMAAIGWESEQNYQYLCGGTLISERYVLTAAHCKFANYYKSRNLRRPDPTVVKLGVTDLQKPSTIIEIQRIIPHRKYAPPIQYYDIALLELRSRVEFKMAVMPACLWSGGNEALKVVATGWGATKIGRTLAAAPSHELHRATMDVMPAAECDDALANHNWPLGVAEHQICVGDASGGGADTCQGDSGSPLQVKRDDGMSYVVGVTSFGYRTCGRYPAIYTRVEHFVSWIEETVWPEYG